MSRHRPVGTVRVCAPFGRGRRAFAWSMARFWARTGAEC